MNAPLMLPQTVDEAVGALTDRPEALPVAGGTDLMLRVRRDGLRPTALVGLAGVGGLRHWTYDDGHVVLGAGLTWARVTRPDVAVLLPVLAAAARTVGVPQIRNAATLGGNLVATTRATDLPTVLAALDGTVRCRSAGGEREFVPLDGEPTAALVRRGELVTGVRLPLLRGPQHFVKVPLDDRAPGEALTVAVVFDRAGIRCAVGGARPGPVRARDSEAAADVRQLMARPGAAAEFAAAVADEVRPEAEQRGVRAHRRRLLAGAVLRAVTGAGTASGTVGTSGIPGTSGSVDDTARGALQGARTG